MRKTLITLLFITALSNVQPCGKGIFIKKAFRVLEITYRQSRLSSVTATEIDHALRLYYLQLEEACQECLAEADANYQYLVSRMEYLYEASKR